MSPKIHIYNPKRFDPEDLKYIKSGAIIYDGGKEENLTEDSNEEEVYMIDTSEPIDADGLFVDNIKVTKVKNENGWRIY